MRWAGHVAQKGKMRVSGKVSMKNTEGMRVIGTSRRRRKQY